MKTIIPKLPDPFVVTPELEEKLKSWIEYFKNLSPRVKVLLPSDQKFDWVEFKKMAKRLARIEEENFDKAILWDWPKKEQVAFCVFYDRALPNHEKEFLFDDAYVFCYRDFAFGFKYFDRVEDEELRHHGDIEYTLRYYPQSALSWNYVAKIIRERLIETEKAIEGNPPPPEEKLFSE